MRIRQTNTETNEMKFFNGPDKLLSGMMDQMRKHYAGQPFKFEIVCNNDAPQSPLIVNEQRAVAREMEGERATSHICQNCGKWYQDYCERCDG